MYIFAAVLISVITEFITPINIYIPVINNIMKIIPSTFKLKDIKHLFFSVVNSGTICSFFSLIFNKNSLIELCLLISLDISVKLSIKAFFSLSIINCFSFS